MTSLSLAPARAAPWRLAPERSAPRRSASFSSAPVRFAPLRSAPRRSAPNRSAPARSAPGQTVSRSIGLGGAARPQGQHLPAAGLDPVRDLRLGDRVQPVGAVARAADRTDVRIEARSHDPLPARPEARL